MRKLVWLLALAVSAIWSTPGRADVDYGKIDRAIAKEPTYQSKTPRYFLMVFGPEAKTRVWCVIDGETLYIDKNGSGDLSEPGKAVKSKDGSFTVDAVTDADGKTKHTGIHMGRTHSSKDGKPEEWIHVKVDINDRYRQYCFVSKMANRADEAPIVHFGGPLRFDVRQSEKTTLVRGDKPSELNLCIVTHPANGEWVAIDHGKGIPADVHPIAEIAFPGKTADAAPIKVKVPITQRC